jgi:surface protein
MSLQISISNVIGNPDFREIPPVINTPFISEWKTTSNNETVTLPYTIGGSYNGTIDWGDGETSVNKYGNRTHTYKFSGTYTITINGRVRIFRFNNSGDKSKIYRILQWGNQFDIGVGGGHFYGCNNLNLEDVVDVITLYRPTISSNTNNFTNLFRDCTSLTTINKIEEWDVSNINNMFGCFAFCPNFNSNISAWEVDNVVNFQSCFNNSLSFNQDISSWNTGNAENMFSMFRNATLFNQNISNWDIENVIDFTNFMLDKTFSNFSSSNYDALLIGWASRPVQPNLSINFGTIKRTSASDAAKLVLTSAPNNWTIVDGGI